MGSEEITVEVGVTIVLLFNKSRCRRSSVDRKGDDGLRDRG